MAQPVLLIAIDSKVRQLFPAIAEEEVMIVIIIFVSIVIVIDIPMIFNMILASVSKVQQFFPEEEVKSSANMTDIQSQERPNADYVTQVSIGWEDEEGDLVTISSDEELAYALQCKKR